MARYPTGEELEQLKSCCGYLKDNAELDVSKLLDFLPEIWWMPDWGIEVKEKKLELHTGGWSGNEEIISILKESLFWALYWDMSKRGGHYYFGLP